MARKKSHKTKKTSIGSSHNSRPRNKNARRHFKVYRGQGGK